MRIVFSLLLMTFLPIYAHAQTPKVERIDIVEYGIYTSDADSKTSVPNVPTGEVLHRANVRLAETTQTVPAQKGVEFGFRFNIVGAPKGKVQLHVVAIFPPPGLLDPSKNKPLTRGEYDRSDAIGSGGYLSYSFNNDWELVPGVWTLQPWFEGRKMAEQKFTVVKR